ncbi:MAG: putative oxidoreductase YjmC [Planctomycetota bacterium]
MTPAPADPSPSTPHSAAPALAATMAAWAESTEKVPIASLRRFCESVLVRCGVSADDAALTADALVTADSCGVFTHGTKLLAGYVRRLEGGGIRATATPRVERDGPSWAIVDGGHALGQVSGAFAMRVAIDKARRTGIAYAGVKHGNHFGAIGYFPCLAAREGLIGIAVGNDIPSVVAPGARVAVTGTNPLAYAIPAGAHDPILLDMATSTVAGGKVYAARSLGKPIPADWLVDKEGQPTTNGHLYPDNAALAPAAGHKGYGIGLLAESLAGALSGASMMWQIGNWMWGAAETPTGHGAAFIAIDPATMTPDFHSRVDYLIDEVHRAPTAAGIDRVQVPGEREWQARRLAEQQGIPLPGDVRKPLAELATRLGLPVELPDQPTSPRSKARP